MIGVVSIIITVVEAETRYMYIPVLSMAYIMAGVGGSFFYPLTGVLGIVAAKRKTFRLVSLQF